MYIYVYVIIIYMPLIDSPFQVGFRKTLRQNHRQILVIIGCHPVATCARHCPPWGLVHPYLQQVRKPETCMPCLVDLGISYNWTIFYFLCSTVAHLLTGWTTKISRSACCVDNDVFWLPLFSFFWKPAIQKHLSKSYVFNWNRSFCPRDSGHSDSSPVSFPLAPRSQPTYPQKGISKQTNPVHKQEFYKVGPPKR